MNRYRHSVITLALVLMASQASAAEFGGIRELFVGPIPRLFPLAGIGRRAEDPDRAGSHVRD